MVFIFITSIYSYLHNFLQNFACYKIAYMYIFVFLNFNILQICILFSLKRVYRINANRNTQVKRIITCKYIRKLEKEKRIHSCSERIIQRQKQTKSKREKNYTPILSYKAKSQNNPSPQGTGNWRIKGIQYINEKSRSDSVHTF